MSSLSPAALKRIKSKVKANATSAELHELGLNTVPVKPNGEVDEAILIAFIDADQTTEHRVGSFEFFRGHILLTPEAAESMRKKPVPPLYDVISGEIETAAVTMEWNALAPIKVAFGEPVRAVDMCAYGKAEGLISRELTSTLARIALPKGTTPIDPPSLLADAALMWPFDERNARETAKVARERGGVDRVIDPPIGKRETAPSQSSGQSSSQTVSNYGTVGSQHNIAGNATVTIGADFSKSKVACVADFFVARFETDELFRALNNFAGKEFTDRLMSYRGARPAEYAFDVAEKLERAGFFTPRAIDGFINMLLSERPRAVNEILLLKARLTA